MGCEDRRYIKRTRFSSGLCDVEREKRRSQRERERERERATDRQTDRQTETDRQTDREKDRQTDRNVRLTDRHRKTGGKPDSVRTKTKRNDLDRQTFPEKQADKDYGR